VWCAAGSGLTRTAITNAGIAVFCPVAYAITTFNTVSAIISNAIGVAAVIIGAELTGRTGPAGPGATIIAAGFSRAIRLAATATVAGAGDAVLPSNAYAIPAKLPALGTVLRACDAVLTPGFLALTITTHAGAAIIRTGQATLTGNAVAIAAEGLSTVFRTVDMVFVAQTDTVTAAVSAAEFDHLADAEIVPDGIAAIGILGTDTGFYRRVAAASRVVSFAAVIQRALTAICGTRGAILIVDADSVSTEAAEPTV